MNIGDEVFVKPKPYGNHTQFKNNIPFENSMATVIELDRLGRACVAFDDFPKVNHREYHNRYWYNVEELEMIE